MWSVCAPPAATTSNIHGAAWPGAYSSSSMLKSDGGSSIGMMSANGAGLLDPWGARLPTELPPAPPQEGLLHALFPPRIAMLPWRRMRYKITPTISLFQSPSNCRAIAGEGSESPSFETCGVPVHHQAPPRNARTRCSTDPPSML